MGRGDAVPPGVDAGGSQQPRGRGTVQLARVLLGSMLFGVVLVVTVREWREVSETVTDIGAPTILVSLGLALAGLVASAVTWRYSLRELGSSVSIPAALKVYLVGQLGKYIPGSVWALFIQMELARAASVRRAQSFGAGVVSIGINMVTGSALALAVLPLVGGDSNLRYVGAGLGIALCAVAIAPPVLGRVADLGLKLARQPPLARRPGWFGILKAGAFSVASWLVYGLALSVLAVGAGAEPAETIALALPAVALAMTIGFVVAIAPSGIGVREAVLVAALAPVLDAPTALGVALVLRLVFTCADLLAAAAVLPIRLGGAGEPRSVLAPD